MAAAFFLCPFTLEPKKIQQKNFPTLRNPQPEGDRPMIRTRLPVLRAIALIVAMMFDCGAAVAGPDQTSADYVLVGCRDAASLITFSELESPKNRLPSWASVRGLLLASASWVSLTEYVFPRVRLLSKPPVSSFSTSTDSPRGFTRTSTGLPLRLCGHIGHVR